MEQINLIEFFHKIPLFSGLDEVELEKLIAMGRELRLQPGEYLIREGEPGEAMYVILEGEFQVTKRAGDTQMVLAKRYAGEVIGEMAVLDKALRSASIIALKPARLLEISQQTFGALLAWSPGAARSVLQTFAARIRNTEAMLRQSEKMASLGTLSAGIAHELNNPAAAARRAASQLREDMAEMEQLTIQLDAMQLNAEQHAALENLRAEIDRHRVEAKPLDPVSKADMEYDTQEWLEEHGIPEAWEIAPQLVALRFDRQHLEALDARFSSKLLPLVVTWIAKRGSIIALTEEITNSTERISDIVKAIKSYSYLDEAPLQEVDVHEGLENTLVILRHKLKGGITIHRNYSRELPKIEAYASELNQVWTNIIDNAIDAMGGKGDLTICTYGEPERVCVEVCDTGPGIPKENQPRIFDAFFTTKPIGVGTGLGLHISYNIIALKHHGQITVESKPGQTCFKVGLPLRMVNEGALVTPPPLGATTTE